ncbi:MAG: hypothetical protein GDA50_07030 [Alphaproteobacteria bacterium GM202ARS2]|nr:hypothetical protein [Alphaproteobacteria bacterium GM202ARS2]
MTDFDDGEFTRALLALCEKIVACTKGGHDPVYLRGILYEQGGLGTVRKLVVKGRNFTWILNKLKKYGCLHLSLEAFITQDPWRSRLVDQGMQGYIDEAEHRLQQLGYERAIGEKMSNSISQREIPGVLIRKLAKLFKLYRHKDIDRIFLDAGVPRLTESYEKEDKVMALLDMVNREYREKRDINPLEILGKILEEFMDSDNSYDESGRNDIHKTLANHGLFYVKGGRITDIRPASRDTPPSVEPSSSAVKEQAPKEETKTASRYGHSGIAQQVKQFSLWRRALDTISHPASIFILTLLGIIASFL